MLNQEASLNLKLGRSAPAAKALEALLALKPENERQVIAQLMDAYTKMGPSGAEKAKELSKRLPDPKEMVGQVDVDAPEKANWAVAGTKLLKKQVAPGSAVPGSPPTPREAGLVLTLHGLLINLVMEKLSFKRKWIIKIN